MRPLHLAAYNADLGGVQDALGSGHAVDSRDDRGFTPLLWACFRGVAGDQSPVVRVLLAAGADPNAVTGSGDANCLILAVKCGSIELIRELVAAGADLNAMVDDVTPLMEAARQGDDETVEAMIRLGANPALVGAGFVAADYAHRGGHDELAARLSVGGS